MLLVTQIIAEIMANVRTRPAAGIDPVAKKHGNEQHSTPFADISALAAAVTAYLIANPPAGGLTIEQIKADTAIADALTKRHAAGSDNQDLSGLQPKEAGKGLSANDYTTEEKNKLAGLTGGLTQAQILRLK